MRTILAMLAVATPLSVLAAAAGEAAAVVPTPASQSVRIDLTHEEAKALDAMNLAPVLAQLPRSFTPEAKQRLGQNLSRYARQAAETPGSTLSIIIDEPVLDTPGIAVTIRQ